MQNTNRNNLKDKIILIIDELSKTFFNQVITIYEFQFSSMILHLVITHLKENYDTYKIHSTIIKMIENYNTSQVIIAKSGKIYEEILNEKIYIDAYRIFEEFIYQLIKSMLLLMPKFLVNKQGKNKMQIQYDEIFENDNIELCRERIIERTAKEIIQNSNINDIMDWIGKRFGIQISLSDKNIKSLFVISKRRNILIHNNGIVNGIYLNDLKQFGIKPKYKIGYLITKALKQELPTTRKVLIDTVNKICKVICNKSKQISEYYKKI